MEKVIIAVHKPKQKEDEEDPLLLFSLVGDSPAYFVFTAKEHYDRFQKEYYVESTEYPISDYEITIQELIIFAKHLTMEKMPHIIFNAIKGESNLVIPNPLLVAEYTELVKGGVIDNSLRKLGTEILVAIPSQIEGMKKALENVKGNFSDFINHVSPLFVSVLNDESLTLVLNFKEGLNEKEKEDVTMNLCNQLRANTALFHTELHFTEEQNLVPEDIIEKVRVNF